MSKIHCECGKWSGEPCQWSGDKTQTVVVEFMPESLRASHAAANNRGVYPYNGAQRIRVEKSCADLMIEHDSEWVEIVG